MTDNEIIRCLRYCRAGDCENCKALNVCDATFSFHKEALDLINRQKAEIEQLKIVAGGLEQALKNVTEEVDRLLKECESKEEAYNKEFCLRKELKAEIERLENDFVNVTKIAKSETIKEFAERLKEKLQWDVEFDNKLVFESDIDNLVKEITE